MYFLSVAYNSKYFWEMIVSALAINFLDQSYTSSLVKHL